MVNKKKMKRKNSQLICGSVGPGPSIYLLPPVLGYENHDVSKWRAPAFSLRVGHTVSPLQELDQTPGPIYNVTGLTRFGKIKVQGFKIKSKERAARLNDNPGPGEYSPEKPSIMVDFRQPGFSLTSRHYKRDLIPTPGPNQYILPDVVGHYVPHLKSVPAYSIYGMHKFQPSYNLPGPGDYLLPECTVYKPKGPRPLISTKKKTAPPIKAPGPTDYAVNFDPVLKKPPVYSFGMKHSHCAGIFQTKLDDLT